MITSRWKEKAPPDLRVQGDMVQGMLYQQYLGKWPHVTSVEGQAAGTVPWNQSADLQSFTFLFSFCFLHRKTLTPDCHEYLPVETNFFPPSLAPPWNTMYPLTYSPHPPINVPCSPTRSASLYFFKEAHDFIRLIYASSISITKWKSMEMESDGGRRTGIKEFSSAHKAPGQCIHRN